MNVADILDRAADLIDRHGWIQRNDFNKSGQMCARGALFCATGSEYKIITLRGTDGRLVDNVIRLRGEPSNALEALGYVQRLLGELIIVWNDCDGRTKDEVTAMLRSAAATWRAQNQIARLGEARYFKPDASGFDSHRAIQTEEAT